MNKVFLLVLSLSFLFACKKSETERIRSTEPATLDTEDWMQHIIAQHEDVTLHDLTISGAHDAGMYVLSNCTFGTNACNTKTQKNSFWEMLSDGVRIFDVRPSWFNNKMYTQHGDCGFFNCKGDLLESILEQVNIYLELHNELVIFQLGLFCDTAPDDTAFVNLVTRKLGDKIFTEPVADYSPFIHRPLKSILNGSKGKILLLLNVDDTPENRAAGFFPGSYVPTSGAWTNSHSYPDLRLKQGQQYQAYTNDGSSLFSFSWQITLSEAQSISCAFDPNAPSIEKNANFINKKLSSFIDSLYTVGEIRTGRIPNIIYSDFTDTLVSKQCIRMSLKNLE